MKLLSIDTPYKDDRTHVLWYLSRKCNFDCWYCADVLHDKTSPQLSAEDAQTAIENIKKVPTRKISLALSGGEPFVNQELVPLLANLKNIPDKDIAINITTNGSFPVAHYLKALPYLSSLTVSAHLDSIQIDPFSKKMAELQSQSSFPLQINVMFVPGMLSSIQDLLAKLKDAGSKPILRRIRKKNTHASCDYSEEEIQFLKSFYSNNEEIHKVNLEIQYDSGEIQTKLVGINHITARNGNFFKGWLCEAGVKNITIWSDGNVYACESALMSKTSIGNFYSKDFKWSSLTPQPCPMHRCVCAADIQIPKRSPDKVG